MLRVKLDRNHWLTAGLDDEIQVIYEGARVFAPLKLDAGRNVGIYANAERLVAAGLVWKEAQPLLAQRAFLMHQPTGRGHVIAFAEDPNYRAFAEATELLFINCGSAGARALTALPKAHDNSQRYQLPTSKSTLSRSAQRSWELEVAELGLDEFLVSPTYRGPNPSL